jgi:hypothetical protein
MDTSEKPMRYAGPLAIAHAHTFDLGGAKHAAQP